MNIETAFKLFDIRGDYPEVVDERLAFIVGKALTLLKCPKRILVASDTRESSPTLKNFLIDGLSVNGAKIDDLFEAPVGQFYYTITAQNYDLGVMVTASHVSSTENGFKFVNKNGLPFDQSEITSLKNLVRQLADENIVVPKLSATRINNTEEYIQEIISFLQPKKFISKVVLDTTRSSVLTPVLVLFSRLGINYSLVKSNHLGNPLLPENRKDLATAVIKNKADLGIIWDSDGDRVIFVDRLGNLIPLSFVLGILGAKEITKKNDKVAVDVRAGLVVRDLVKAAGGQLEIFPAWSQYIKFGMQTDPKIVFGGETSGHFVFRRFHKTDDAILASLIFLGLWETDNLEEKLGQLDKKYFELPEKNFPVDLNKTADILEKLTEYYRKLDYEVSIKDGLTVFGSGFKFNLRSSLTEPFLRLNLEAQSEKQSKEIINELEKHLLV